MTSSGTYAYSLSNGEAVLSAFERCQLRLPSLRQEHFRSARVESNLLFASWANETPNLWKVELISLSLTNGSTIYDVPTRVVAILDGYLTTNNGATTQIDRYMTPISRTEYDSYASKYQAGLPTVYWHDKLLSPTVTLWPVINTTSYVFNYHAATQIQDAALAAGQTPDIPYVWYDAFVSGLAHRLARIYAPQLEQVREQDAKKAWDIAAAQNTEQVNLKLTPDLSGYYR